MDWRTAILFCKSFNMELATFSTKQEEDDFFNMLTKGNKEVDNLFVGATDEGSESEWYNMPSSTKIEYNIRFPVKSAGYKDTTKNCMAVLKNESIFYLDDVDCGSVRNCVCQDLRLKSDDDKSIKKNHK